MEVKICKEWSLCDPSRTVGISEEAFCVIQTCLSGIKDQGNKDEDYNQEEDNKCENNDQKMRMIDQVFKVKHSKLQEKPISVSTRNRIKFSFPRLTHSSYSSMINILLLSTCILFSSILVRVII